MLQEHAWFASSRFSELVEMLIDLQSPADTSSQRSRFACFHILLVHSLKVKNSKFFLERSYASFFFFFKLCFWYRKYSSVTE